MATLNVADLNRQGKVFSAANAAAATLSVVGTAMTGLIVHNPANSGVKLVMVEAGFAWVTVPAAQQTIGVALLGPQVTAPATLTAVAPLAMDGSARSGSAIAWSVATLAAAPVVRQWIRGVIWFTSGVSVQSHEAGTRLDGNLVVIPGATAHLAALTTAPSGVGHFVWAELPM